tara:strand:+ start:774 stop:1193 length:420 start_codon:yes stop_codon:yes gene_type:complete
MLQMRNFASSGYPHEVCGILAGVRAAGGRPAHVREVVELVNERADSPANRYQVSGLLVHRAEEALERRGLEVVGYYHSHPDHPSRYSDYDRDHALPDMSYVIVSVCSGMVAHVASWRLSDDRTCMHPEQIETGDNPGLE